MSVHSANPKSFGYLIDLLHIRAIFHLSVVTFRHSSMRSFLPAFHSDLFLLAASARFTDMSACAFSSVLYHTMQAFSEHCFLAMLFCLVSTNDFTTI